MLPKCGGTRCASGGSETLDSLVSGHGLEASAVLVKTVVFADIWQRDMPTSSSIRVLTSSIPVFSLSS